MSCGNHCFRVLWDKWAAATGGFVILFGLTGFCDPAFRGVCLHDGRCDHSLLDVAGNFLDDCMFGHCCSKKNVLKQRCAGRWMRKHYRWNIVRLTLSDFSIHMNVNGFKACMILWLHMFVTVIVLNSFVVLIPRFTVVMVWRMIFLAASD